MPLADLQSRPQATSGPQQYRGSSLASDVLWPLLGVRMSADKGFLGVKMQNGDGAVLKASKHNKRKLPSHFGANPALSRLNYSLRGPETPEQVAELAKKLMSDVGINKPKRRDTITEIEFVASLPVGSNIDSAKYFMEFVEFVECRFGKQNMLSADVHLDESAPHCHILIIPLDGNRMNASDIIGNKTKLSALNADVHAEAASKHGIIRPIPKLFGNSKMDAAKLMRDRLIENSDVATISSVRDVICQFIEQFPEPFKEALGTKESVPIQPATTFGQIATGARPQPDTYAGAAQRNRSSTRLGMTTTRISDRSEAQPVPCGQAAKFIPTCWLSQDYAESYRLVQFPVLQLVASEYTCNGSINVLAPETWAFSRGDYIKLPRTCASTQAEVDNWEGNALLAKRRASR